MNNLLHLSGVSHVKCQGQNSVPKALFEVATSSHCMRKSRIETTETRDRIVSVAASFCGPGTGQCWNARRDERRGAHGRRLLSRRISVHWHYWAPNSCMQLRRFKPVAWRGMRDVHLWLRCPTNSPTSEAAAEATDIVSILIGAVTVAGLAPDS